MSRNHWLNFIVIETPLGCSRLTLGRHWVWKATWWKKRWSVTPFKQYQYYLHFLQVLRFWVSEVLETKKVQRKFKKALMHFAESTLPMQLSDANCQIVRCQLPADVRKSSSDRNIWPMSIALGGQSGAKSWLTYMQYHNPDSTSRREAKKRQK